MQMSHQQEVDFACTVLQRADTDTKKLAALLLIGKLFSQKELSEEDKSKILKLLEGDFLLRLLNDYYENISNPRPDMDGNDTSFCLDIIPHFISTLIQEYDKCDSIFEILSKILLLTSQDSTKYDPQIIENVFDCFSFLNHSLAYINNEKVKIYVSIYIENILKIYFTGKEINDKVENLFIELSQFLESQHFYQLIQPLAQQFHSSQTLEKFKLCHLIKLLVQSSNKVPFMADQIWIEHIRDALYDIFKSKLNEEHRNNALDLATQMTLKVNGLDWIKCREWNDHNSKFFALLLRLVCIEVEISLSRYYSDSKCDSERIGACLILLEHLMFALINNLDEDVVTQNEQLKLSNNIISSSIQAITRTMSKVIEFIKEVSIQEKRPLSGDILHLTIASIRVLCAYLNEESESLRDESRELFPFIQDIMLQHNSNEQMKEIETLIRDTLKNEMNIDP